MINGQALKQLCLQISKIEFDKNPVLDRFDHQLKTSGLNTLNTMKPDFSWACTNIDNIKNNYDLNKYIILFPFAQLIYKLKNGLITMS